MLDFLVPVEAAIAIGQPVLRGTCGNAVFHLREMLVIFDFITLFDSEIPGIRIYCVVIFAHQMMRLDDVMRIGCCVRYGMDIACAGVRASLSDNKALSCRPSPTRESSRPSTRGIIRAESDGCDCHIRNL